MTQLPTVSGMTVQVRVSDFAAGVKWYHQLLERPPDFVPHEGFSKWELVPNSNCWLQVAAGTPAVGSGPLRLGVADIDSELARLQDTLGITRPPISQTLDGTVRYCTFEDPFGNRIGLFQESDRAQNVG